MNNKILVLGASGYVGSAFVAELNRRKANYYTLSSRTFDYTRFDLLWNHLNQYRPAFVVNAAGYTGKPNVDACEQAKADTIDGNVLLPQTLAEACYAANIPFGHVSSGCIYSGAKIANRGIVKDLTTPEMKEIIATEMEESHFGRNPVRVFGFTEEDTPNFSFRQDPCSFYSGTKALSEESIVRLNNGYFWRLRIPFDENNNPRNYLTKVQTYSKVYDNVNSISHLGDFAKACMDLWEFGAEFGIYNVVNPGWVTTRYIVSQIQEILKPQRKFEFWENDAEFYQFAIAPRSNCVLDASKLRNAGVYMRPAWSAVVSALNSWRA